MGLQWAPRSPWHVGSFSCGKIWKLESGRVALTAGGKLTVDIHGPVALVCGDKGGAVVAQTEPKALNQSGDAGIEATLSIPKACVDPVVLVRERYEGKIGGWLATTRK
jgi:hypothetical protein